MTRSRITPILLLFTIAAIPAIDFAAHEIRMLQTFSLDEAAFATQVREILVSQSLAVDGFIYGSVYPYLGALISTLYGLLFEVTDTTVIIVLRLISISATLVTAVVAGAMAKRHYSQEVGITSAALTLSTPLIYRWSIEIHPDLLQLCFLTCSLYAITELSHTFSLRSVSLSGLFAGLAMGTKYGGAFLLPTITLALVLGTPGGLAAAFQSRRFWTGSVVAAVSFCTAYAVTNPYAILNLSALVQDLSFAGRIVSDQEEGGGVGWIWMLLDPTLGVVILLGVTALFTAIWRRDWAASRCTACLMFWTTTYLGFLLLNVRFIAGQYLLPLIPALAILAGARIEEFVKGTKRGRILAISAIVTVQIAYAVPILATRTRGESDNPVIAAGLWLSESYDAETTVLYDAYAYVPEKFDLADDYFGLSYALIGIYQPDLVVTRSSIRDRYADPNQSRHFRLTDREDEQEDFLYLSPQRYRDIHYTYVYLEQDRTDYTVVQDFGDVTIYAKRQPTNHSDKRARWDQISNGQKGEGVDAATAAGSYARYGDIHSAAENWVEAKTQYGKAAQFDPGNILPQYGYALALAHQDSFAAAESHIDRLAQLTGQPADLWLKLGWDYYEMAEHDRSRKASERAIALAPEHPFPLYNIALTYLVESQTDLASQAYERALANQALPPATADLLTTMISEGTLQGESRDIAQRVISTTAP